MENNQETRSKRLKEAIDYLKKNGIVDSQKDLAAKLRVTPETISRAKKCQGDYPSENLMEKFARVFSYEFNEDYIINGKGTLLKQEESITEETQNEIIMRLLNTISFLQQQIEIKDEEIEKLHLVIEKFSNASTDSNFDNKKNANLK